MLIHPWDFHSEAYKKEKMGPRQSQQSHEVQGEETNKIQETNLNLGLVNFYFHF